MTHPKTPIGTPPVDSADIDSFPGHRIRRLQQMAVAMVMQECPDGSVTPVQFAVLYTLAQPAGIDQRRLADAVSFDTSTIGGVVDRLEARGLLTRSLSELDRRVRLLHLTPEGEALLQSLMPDMQRAQQRMLAPLKAQERAEFMRLMGVVLTHHDAQGRN